MSMPLFEERALATLKRAREIFAGRGTEYGDTWRECQFVMMKAVARELGLEINPIFLRAIATAAFCDMKYWRLMGGYKDDSLIDSINYQAYLAEEMKKLKEMMTTTLKQPLSLDSQMKSYIPK